MGAQDDKNKGRFEEAKGKAKQAWGDLTDDEKAKTSGEADETKGKGRQKYSEAKEWVEEKTGDDDENRQDRA